MKDKIDLWAELGLLTHAEFEVAKKILDREGKGPEGHGGGTIESFLEASGFLVAGAGRQLQAQQAGYVDLPTLAHLRGDAADSLLSEWNDLLDLESDSVDQSSPNHELASSLIEFAELEEEENSEESGDDDDSESFSDEPPAESSQEGPDQFAPIANRRHESPLAHDLNDILERLSASWIASFDDQGFLLGSHSNDRSALEHWLGAQSQPIALPKGDPAVMRMRFTDGSGAMVSWSRSGQSLIVGFSKISWSDATPDIPSLLWASPN